MFSIESIGCKACSLSSHTKLRALSVGNTDAKIMLLGPDLRATQAHNFGIGGHSLSYGSTRLEVSPGGFFVDYWCQTRGRDASLFYSAFVVKCVTPLGDSSPLEIHNDRCALTCMRRYLALEIERVCPEVILCFGEIAWAAMGLYWSCSSRYRSSQGEAFTVKAPASWPHSFVELMRAPELRAGHLLDLEQMARLLDEALGYVQSP
jgi:uracil-DNA glycosylase